MNILVFISIWYARLLLILDQERCVFFFMDLHTVATVSYLFGRPHFQP